MLEAVMVIWEIDVSGTDMQKIEKQARNFALKTSKSHSELEN